MCKLNKVMKSTFPNSKTSTPRTELTTPNVVKVISKVFKLCKFYKKPQHMSHATVGNENCVNTRRMRALGLPPEYRLRLCYSYSGFFIIRTVKTNKNSSRTIKTVLLLCN